MNALPDELKLQIFFSSPTIHQLLKICQVSREWSTLLSSEKATPFWHQLYTSLGWHLRKHVNIWQDFKRRKMFRLFNLEAIVNSLYPKDNSFKKYLSIYHAHWWSGCLGFYRENPNRLEFYRYPHFSFEKSFLYPSSCSKILTSEEYLLVISDRIFVYQQLETPIIISNPNLDLQATLFLEGSYLRFQSYSPQEHAFYTKVLVLPQGKVLDMGKGKALGIASNQLIYVETGNLSLISLLNQEKTTVPLPEIPPGTFRLLQGNPLIAYDEAFSTFHVFTLKGERLWSKPMLGPFKERMIDLGSGFLLFLQMNDQNDGRQQIVDAWTGDIVQENPFSTTKVVKRVFTYRYKPKGYFLELYGKSIMGPNLSFLVP